MKAILVIDMPGCCLDCSCSYTYGYAVGTPTDDICEVADRKLSKENMNNTKPVWCPLKPLPNKRKMPITKTFGTDFNKGQVVGWNDCIDEILGEAE